MTDETKKCSYCGGEILVSAIKCKHCREFLHGLSRVVSTKKRWYEKTSVSLVVAALLIAAYVLLGPGLIHRISTELNLYSSLQEEVRKSIEETLPNVPDLSTAKIQSLVLVHKTGNQYEGILEIIDYNSILTDTESKRKLIVDVTYDGKNIMWQLRQ